jgi:TFIIF-interacting CTD phosphatase-like protein
MKTRSKITSKNIVLDIDETLILSLLTPSDINSVDLTNPDNYNNLSLIFIDKSPIYVFLRPYCQSFLRFCFKYFDKVIVWSAGSSEYVNAVVNKLFYGIGRPYRVYDRSFCENTITGYTKPLSKLIKEIPSLSLSNTIIVDDKISNFDKNPSNGILIPAYSTVNNNDDALVKLVQWLLSKDVMETNDIRVIPKDNIFTEQLPLFSYAKAMLVGYAPTC